MQTENKDLIIQYEVLTERYKELKKQYKLTLLLLREKMESLNSFLNREEEKKIALRQGLLRIKEKLNPKIFEKFLKELNVDPDSLRSN